jgi:hypothetical protein
MQLQSMVNTSMTAPAQNNTDLAEPVCVTHPPRD